MRNDDFMTKRKKIVATAAVIIFVILLVGTFLSRTVYTALLPKAQVAAPTMGSIASSSEADANFKYKNLVPLRARESFYVSEVKIAKQQEVEKKDVLFTVLPDDPSRKDKDFTSDISGTLYNLHIEDGQFVDRGQLLAEFLTEKSTAYIEWAMPRSASKYYDVGDNIQILSERDSGYETSKKTLTKQIATRKFDVETDSYIFTADLDAEDEITENSVISVKMSRDSEYYTCLLPKSCVMKDENGRDFVYLINEADGLFGKETAVEKYTVEVLDQNSYMVAVAEIGYSDTGEVLQYVDKPLRDGDTVSVLR